MDRREAINDLKTIKAFFEDECNAYPMSLEYAIKALESEAEIVHCEECKYGEYRKDHDDYLCKDDGLSVHDADFYCADGERKSDE